MFIRITARPVPKRVKGDVVFQTCLPLGVVMDERICSGHYFASCFQNMRRYFAHPELLEMTLDEDLAAENTVSENRKEDKA